MERTLEYKSGRFYFSLFAFLVTIPLLYAGGFTTSIGAGMVFPDWPLSNNSINPEGWIQDEAMRAEHGHRLFGALVGFLTLTLAVWVCLTDSRKWLRRTAVFAVIMVIVQGLLGGLRVLLVDVHLAIPHAFIAQVFFCMLATITIANSRIWFKDDVSDSDYHTLSKVRKGAIVLVVLILAQLLIAAIMRHRGAGLSIYTFPYSTENGDWLPLFWDFNVAIHFAHRVMAFVILLAFIYWVAIAFRNPALPKTVRKLIYPAKFLLLFQIGLGISVIWTLKRNPNITTLHVICGAFLLCTCWIIVFYLFKRPNPTNQSLTKR